MASQFLSKYKRFFAFGCSFTDYRWPTWADILGKEFPGAYFNFGGAGSSNPMIARSVSEADVICKFRETDLVIIMWTDVCREEVYVNRYIAGTGNVMHEENILRRPHIEYLPETYYKRDLLCINMASKFLEGLGVDHYMFSTVPINYTEGNSLIPIKDHIKNLLAPIERKITHNFFNTCYKKDWSEQNPIKLICNGEVTLDSHPSPTLHLQFLQSVLPNLDLSENTLEYVKYYDNKVKTPIDVSVRGHIFDKEHMNIRI